MHKFGILAPFAALLFAAGIASAADYVAAPLSGGEEVPSNDSKARGNATFDLSDDGTAIEYKLIVANIDNVVASHIHVGPLGVNGPVVAFLFGPAAPGGGASNGVIASGTITAANLVGPLTGHPLSDLVAAMQSGGAYVNVHTNDGVAPTNTGPGDFPGGEIRAQIRPGGEE
ncbi:MAG TPA: CHRD domain-containing protein [Candidatus Eisenbacteria bacterium]|nr:CHRD domain-containing protein [Candidatus Eisenbacteria bacterium]